MGDLTKNFSRSEFECKCGCGFDDINEDLVDIMQTIRDDIGVIRINSGCRCPEHNKESGGSENSRHTYPYYDACDFVADSLTPEEVQEYLLHRFPNEFGIGRYNTFTHFDIRSKKARWDYRK